ncbi:Plasmodium exported protein, unknown function [Plasmodium relictum]|uniref:Uncharacterized protein n=1 Tax=Plasmodium relictum TaxID=85471 RepID=A0A1J1H3U4_PLARL|nr:Plasmodium exported protein, unknown function [Plasmodium relictum]CRG99572.1 Plasmodium exported protein, unknown function [Plasmodium relictum]
MNCSKTKNKIKKNTNTPLLAEIYCGLYYNKLHSKKLAERNVNHGESSESSSCKVISQNYQLEDKKQNLCTLENNGKRDKKRNNVEVNDKISKKSKEEKIKMNAKDIWLQKCLDERVQYWQKRMRHWTEIEGIMWREWYFGSKTKDMNEEWKHNKWEEWFTIFSRKMWKEDVKDTKSFKKKIKNEYSLEYITSSFKKKEKSFKNKKDKLMEEWNKFVKKAEEEWKKEKKEIKKKKR